MIESGEIQYESGLSDEEIQKITENVKNGLRDNLQKYLTQEELNRTVQNMLTSIQNTYPSQEEFLKQIDAITNQFITIEGDISSLQQEFNSFQKEIVEYTENRIDELNKKLEVRIEKNEDSILAIRQEIIELRQNYDNKFSEFEITYNKKLEELNASNGEDLSKLEKRISDNAKSIAEIEQKMNELQEKLETEIADLENTYNAKLEEMSTELNQNILNLKIETDQNLAELETGVNQNIQDLGNTVDKNMEDLKTEQNLSIANLKTEITQSLATLETAIDQKMEELKNYADEKLENLEKREDQNEKNIGNIESLKTSDKSSFTNALNEVFTLVSDGKSKLASTLTDKGINTASDATFEEIDNNIKKLYAKAFTDGASSVTTPNPNIIYEYHYHEGSPNVKGGCYTVEKYHAHGDGCVTPTRGRLVMANKGWEWVFISCAQCGENLGSFNGSTPHSDRFNNFTEEAKVVFNECQNSSYWGKIDGQAQYFTSPTQWHYCGGYSLNCSKNESTLEGYTTGCGYADGQIISAKIIFEGEGSDQEPAAVSSYKYKDLINQCNTVDNTFPFPDPEDNISESEIEDNQIMNEEKEKEEEKKDDLSGDTLSGNDQATSGGKEEKKKDDINSGGAEKISVSGNDGR